MNLTDEMKTRIGSMGYEDLLETWRNTPLGDSRFSGETGQYWKKSTDQSRGQPGGQEQHVQASKDIGWAGRGGVG